MASSNWQMPRPNRGQVVLFYYKSTVSKRNTDIAFVKSVDEKSVDLIFQGQGFNECRHVDDPFVRENPSIRQDLGGLWDWTEETKQHMAQAAEFEERIARLEAALIGCDNSKPAVSTKKKREPVLEPAKAE